MKHLNKKQAKRLFEKYLDGSCSPEEEALLEGFLESYQDEGRLSMDFDFEASIKEQVWDKVRRQTLNKKDTKSRKWPVHRVLRYAAVFVGALVLSLSYYLFEDRTQENHLDIVEGMIVLETEDGKSNLNENVVGEITDKSGATIASHQNGVLTYQRVNSVDEVIYNAIDVPKGKTYKVVLSDGTLVHLNAGTSLRFPMNFLTEGNRQVFLTGEAYFEVARDESRPFIVQANDLEIKVLGTHFNVSSYKGSIEHAVLVEGSVEVNNRGSMVTNFEPLIIQPGQKASLVPEGVAIDEVDVQDYIGWTRDLLIFNDEPFSDIVLKIERRYNVGIRNNYKELSTVRFNGKFNEESIIELMDTFKESANFDYQIDNGKIIINKKESAYEEMN